MIFASKGWGKGGEGLSDQSTMLGVTDVVEVGTFLRLSVADQHLGDVTIECYDFTAEGYWAEVSTSVLHCR